MPVHRNLKGQGAMEYLMTYSWAILVVAIVGMVLWQIGVFDTHEDAIPTGWSTLKPMPPTIVYSAAGNIFDDAMYGRFSRFVNCKDAQVGGVDLKWVTVTVRYDNQVMTALSTLVMP